MRLLPKKIIYRRTVSFFVFKLFSVLTVLSIVSGPLFPIQFPAYSQDEITEYQSELEEKTAEIAEKEKILAETRKEIERISESKASVSEKIAMIDAKLYQTKTRLDKSQAIIDEKASQLAEKEKILLEKKNAADQVSRQIYKSSRMSIVETILSQEGTDSLLRAFNYKKYALSSHINSMRKIAGEYSYLQEQQKLLEREKAVILAEKEALDQSRKSYEKERERIQWEMNNKISAKDQLKHDIAKLNDDVSELQEAIMEIKSGYMVTSVGSVPSDSDSNSSYEGFKQNAPAGYFGVFTFGAYTHRKGMSQYGALGRAQSGQNYRQILSAYYGKEPATIDTSGDISVTGYGDMDFETEYLYGVSEMSASWDMEVLKAQAVASRSYAYRYKKADKSICTTQQCQVFKKSHSEDPLDRWKEAVDATRGQVIEDVVTFFASTSGGYLSTSGWDTTNGNNSGNWAERAYEAIAGAGWFYKAWYKSYSSSGWLSCDEKPNAWLSEEEMADLLNAWLFLKKDGVKEGADSDRLVSVTIDDCPIPGADDDIEPYSHEELRGILENPVINISGKPVTISNNEGSTVEVIFQTNRGEMKIPGSEFKEVFNTRSPGYMGIHQSGFQFFNIERK